jgi:hypothetical protein
MNTSAFDPSVFLDAQISEVNEKRPTLPVENPSAEDGLYLAVIGEIKTDAGTIGKGDKIGQPWVSMLVPCRIQISPELQSLGLPPELTITDRVFLDLTPEGSIDNSKGKNRQQKNYREATDLNSPGQVFAWRMLTGKVVKVKVAHELYEGNIQERIVQVLPS